MIKRVSSESCDRLEQAWSKATPTSGLMLSSSGSGSSSEANPVFALLNHIRFFSVQLVNPPHPPSSPPSELCAVCLPVEGSASAAGLAQLQSAADTSQRESTIPPLGVLLTSFLPPSRILTTMQL